VLFADRLVAVRGGGDLATGVVYRLRRAGFPVVVCELAQPLTVRRTVALSSAVSAGEVAVAGIVGRLTRVEDAAPLASSGVVPVVVSPELPSRALLPATVVVDARMAKAPLGTTVHDAPLVVALGPGFTVGVHCHAVVETMRGPHLGRVLWHGSALPNTGVPGELGGHGTERVLRAPADGVVQWDCDIGQVVAAGDRLGEVGGTAVHAAIPGLVRGLVAPGTSVPAGVKIGDIDPRPDASWREISDKALAIGGGVVEAVLTWTNGQARR
jgi:xanthine dehydrogenase accessory factor